MKQCHFDLICGAGGDMLLSSLIDAGVPLDWLRKQLARLKLAGLRIDAERVSRSHLSGLHLVVTEGSPHEYRHLPQILAIVKRGAFPEGAIRRCEKVLTRLAAAEARVHGIAIDKVHFHEIGAVDTIVDILGVCLCLDYLAIELVTFPALTEGHGTIQVAHGIMPVPAPATAELMKGFAVRTLDVPTELLTPTACALLTTLGKQVETMPAGTIESIGIGCGTKVIEHHPNMLRVFVLKGTTPDTTPDSVTVLESDMDHISGEVMGHAAQQLMSAGALDVSWTPVFMKKGRPGYRVTVACDDDKREQMAALIMAETHTLGVRYQTMRRIIAPRESSTALLDGTVIRRKRYEIGGESFTKAEYDDLAKVARKTGKSLLAVMDRYARNGFRSSEKRAPARKASGKGTR